MENVENKSTFASSFLKQVEELVNVNNQQGLESLLSETDEAKLVNLLDSCDDKKFLGLIFKSVPFAIFISIFTKLDESHKTSLLGLLDPEIAQKLLEVVSFGDTNTNINEMINSSSPYLCSKFDGLKAKTECKADTIDAYVNKFGETSGPHNQKSFYDFSLDPNETPRYKAYIVDPEGNVTSIYEIKQTTIKSGVQATISDNSTIYQLADSNHNIKLAVEDNNVKIAEIELVKEEKTKVDPNLKSREKPYLQSSIGEIYGKRIFWLIFLMAAGIITSMILEGFEEAIATLPILVAFLPMLNDTGGNAGSQSSTSVVQGLSKGEIKVNDFFKVFFKELQIALLIALTIAALNFGRIIVHYYLILHKFEIIEAMKYGATVSITLFVTVILAKLVGICLPFLAKKLKTDPAISAAPVITTIVDCITIVLYFALACLFFPQLA